MRQYPSITTHIDRTVPVVAFQKLDGSNIRAEWNAKRGFYKFGSRTRLIDKNERPLGDAISLIDASYGAGLAASFLERRIERAICFFEFLGDNSFAGQHCEEEHRVVLIDVSVHRKGFVGPEEFIRDYGRLGIPDVVFRGLVDETTEARMRSGLICQGEGVVCRSLDGRVSFKVKTHAWLERLQQKCGDDEALFQRLL